MTETEETLRQIQQLVRNTTERVEIDGRTIPDAIAKAENLIEAVTALLVLDKPLLIYSANEVLYMGRRYYQKRKNIP